MDLYNELRVIGLTSDQCCKVNDLVEKLKNEIREQLANYVKSEGCSCCQDRDEHEKAEEQLAKLLGVEPYEDGSGYNFYKYITKK